VCSALCLRGQARAKMTIIIEFSLKLLQAQCAGQLSIAIGRDIGIRERVRDANAIEPSPVQQDNVLKPPQRPPGRRRAPDFYRQLLGISQSI
jgi:hypothetical protein